MMDSFVRSRAVMRRRHRGWMNECARESAMDDRRCARAFDRRRWCAREDDEGETRRRTGEEKYIYICVFSSRAREGETRRGIEETRD